MCFFPKARTAVDRATFKKHAANRIYRRFSPFFSDFVKKANDRTIQIPTQLIRAVFRKWIRCLFGYLNKAVVRILDLLHAGGSNKVQAETHIDYRTDNGWGRNFRAAPGRF